MEVLDDFVELLDQWLQFLDVLVLQHPDLLLDVEQLDELEEFLHKLVELGENVAFIVEIELLTLGLLVKLFLCHVLGALLLLVELDALLEHVDQVLDWLEVPDLVQVGLVFHDKVEAVLYHLGCQLLEK